MHFLVVEEANVLVHVEDVAVTEALHILADIRDLLQILVLPVVENWIIDNDAVDSVILVGGYEVLLELFTIYFPKLESEATAEKVRPVYKLQLRRCRKYTANVHSINDLKY